ncbi:hypothetical protein TVAG_165240 [Trichomonas vaginalis G3]|uniref:Uncharacterized protein n=1 Tax=Trichomonas vaginalis (strain ATCC PRA-98 / G3) TaxID=412133 RepID=A2DUK5_TRIV3|nr:hypothetical protein TVAGG3_0663030 [Trichomonas vaginalis G3]EAY15896.1 hypothetical protein TVAG_165240 [Trichomonas vaginalis G3]KAI5506643.1 hypothetical protein TVAGG3_0663030 [Trichomonas vaginalis G3]|eukprot:XP_001328119.1 hypothetical protein [Trichomonas vaginalis G3]
MDELLKKYDELKPYLFPNIALKLDEIDASGNQLTRHVLRKNRQSIYELFAHDFIDYQKNSSYFSDLLESSYQTPVDSLLIINPLHAQGLCQLLQTIYSNPKSLAKAISENLSSPYFHHIVNLAIPAIYGFFSTKEQGAQALSFYTCLSAQVNFSVYCHIIKPFFMNSNMDNFINQLVTAIFFSNYLKKFNPDRFCDLIVNKTQKFLRFLPTSQFQLLRFLSLQWDNVSIWRLIINCLIIPAFTLQYHFNPFAHSYLVKFDLQQVIKCLQTYDAFPTINLSVSWPLEIPGDFVFLNNTCTYEIILTKADIEAIQCFTNYMTYHGPKLPEILKEIKSPSFKPFSIVFFPKIPLPPSFPSRPLFFETKTYEPPNDNRMAQMWVSICEAATEIREDPINVIRNKIQTQNHMLNAKLAEMNMDDVLMYGVQTELSELSNNARNFERLLNHKLEMSRMNGFNALCGIFESKTSFLVAKKMVNKVKGKFWQIISNMSGTSHVRFHSAIIMLDQGENEFLKPIKSSLSVLHKKFAKVTEMKMVECSKEITLGSTSFQSQISENNVLLSIVNESSSFLSRATVLLYYLKTFNTFCECYSIDDTRESYDQMMHYAISMNNTSWLLKTVLLLDGTLFGDARYEKEIGKMYLDLWQKFKASFLQYLSYDEQLLVGYIKLSGEGTLTSAN